MTSQVSSKYVYILADGIPDVGIKEVYNRLEEQGALRWLLFSSKDTSYEEFLKIVRAPSNTFYVTVDTETQQLVSVFWINNRTNINASIHTAFFKEYLGKTVGISKDIVSWVFLEFPQLESLLCFIPETNKLANKFIKRIGWNKAGTVPRLIKDAKTSNIVAGNMYYILKSEA